MDVYRQLRSRKGLATLRRHGSHAGHRRIARASASIVRTTPRRHPLRYPRNSRIRAICVVVGNASENLGIRTGFPFGHYYFTDLIGPSLLHVPILLGLAYVGMGYLCWTLGGLIVGEPGVS